MRTLLEQFRQRIRQITLVSFTVIYLIAGTLILAFDTQLQIGDVAREDIFAPRSIIYESAVLTEEARSRARASVEPVYNRVPNVGSERAILVDRTVEYINLVRRDPYASQEQKLADLRAITALTTIQPEIWLTVLATDANEWNRVVIDIKDVLNRAMRQAIPPDGIGLAREELYTRVDSSLGDNEQQIVISIVGELLVPNRVLDEETTRLNQDLKAIEVEPQLRSFESGEIVVAKGTPIEALDIEALRALDLIGVDHNNWRGYLSAFLMLTLVSGLSLTYARRFYPEVVLSQSMFILVGALLLLFMGGAKAFGPDGLEAQNLFPAAALGLLFTTLVGTHMATVAVISLAVLVAGIADNSLEYATLIAVGGLSGILALKHLERLNAYFIAGVVIGLANAIVLSAFDLSRNEGTLSLLPALQGLAEESIIGLTNGLFAAGVAMVLLFVISSTLNLTTSFKLIELMQPNQPLLQRLLRETPGTYQHSLQVANLAEQATERIGGNSTLVRVGAMYHDIGKMLNPQFFVENQAFDFNPHDLLEDPYQSARIIIGHVIEGDRMARRYRLPQRIRDFIREHHGTGVPVYFYRKALERENNDECKVNLKDFMYPGPRPQSKETAILMLADGTESAARAAKPRSEEEIIRVVDMIFEGHLKDGQLNESNLTLKDLKTIRQVFIETLQGIYHTRIAYPEPLSFRQTNDPLKALPAATPSLPANVPRTATHTPPRLDKRTTGTALVVTFDNDNDAVTPSAFYEQDNSKVTTPLQKPPVDKIKESGEQSPNE